MKEGLYLISTTVFVLLGSAYFIATADGARWECVELMSAYARDGTVPGADDPMRQTFFDCYYAACGVRFASDSRSAELIRFPSPLFWRTE